MMAGSREAPWTALTCSASSPTSGQAGWIMWSSTRFEREGAKTRALKLFEAARKELGPDIELLHDAHERYTPSEAVQLCKDLEQYRLFFLEDPLSPEDIMWFPNIRAQTTT